MDLRVRVLPGQAFALANTVRLSLRDAARLCPAGPPYYVGVDDYVYVAEVAARGHAGTICVNEFQWAEVGAGVDGLVRVRPVARPIWITGGAVRVAKRSDAPDLAVPADYVRAQLRALRGRVLSVGQTLAVEVFLPDGPRVLAARVVRLAGASGDRILGGERGGPVATGVLSAAAEFELAGGAGLRLT